MQDFPYRRPSGYNSWSGGSHAVSYRGDLILPRVVGTGAFARCDRPSASYIVTQVDLERSLSPAQDAGVKLRIAGVSTTRPVTTYPGGCRTHCRTWLVSACRSGSHRSRAGSVAASETCRRQLRHRPRRQVPSEFRALDPGENWTPTGQITEPQPMATRRCV